jgi:hypothetical protein
MPTLDEINAAAPETPVFVAAPTSDPKTFWGALGCSCFAF